MPAPQTFNGDVQINGALNVTGNIAGHIPRDQIDLQLDGVSLLVHDWRVWDAYQTLLGTPAADDLGVVTGTFGTGVPYISTGDLKATTTTRRARQLIRVPDTYVDQQQIYVEFYVGMLTTIADSSCLIDLEAFRAVGTTLVSGTDLVTTAAQSMNSLTFTLKPFELDATQIEPGMLLDLRVSITVTDAATATAVIGVIALANMQAMVQG